MRRRFDSALVLVGVMLAATWSVRAQHQHGQHQPAAQASKAKPAEPERKRDPNRPKPENQPGATMNAEELAASHADHHEMETHEGGGVLPAGWKHRFDLASMKIEHMRFMRMENALHITTGPPGIFYDPGVTATGNYEVKATFTQLAKGEHREGYGPFIGGADLDAADQRYTYFLIRQDGKFLIKQRAGVNTKGIVDWTTHAAIKSFGADGKMTNELAIVTGPADVRFLINGTEVARKPRTDIHGDGVVGLRINHQLNLHIEGFGVHAAPTH